VYYNRQEVVEWEAMKVLKRWQFWLGIAVSLFFLYFSLRGLRLLDLAAVLKNANYWWLIPGVAVYFLAVWARAWRWHYLLRPIKPIPTRTLFPITVIGYLGNNIFPARAGELLRSVVLKIDQQVAISASLATIIVERIFDGVVMLGFVFVNLAEIANMTAASGFIGNIQQLAFWGVGIFVGALVIFLLAAMFPDRSLALLQIGARILPLRFRQKLLDLAENFLGGLAALRSPVGVLMIFLTSVVIWLLETVKYWLVMHAFPFEVSFFTLMLMNGLVNLATTIPSAPGYIGTFDAPGIAVLSASGVVKSIAAAYTLVLHAALWFPITALGFYYLLRKGISWSLENLEQIKAEG
jgi:glycosyltransferase 2 family protein